MSDAFYEYERLIKELDAFRKTNPDADDEHIIERMDRPWYAMTEDERNILRGIPPAQKS